MHLLLLLISCVFGRALTNDERDLILQAHTAERAKYGLGPLVWDEAIAAKMAEYLGTCALEHSSWGFRTYDSGAFGTGGGLHGENLAWSSGGEACSFPTHKWIEAWSTERANYNCLTNQAQDDKPIGHWTQIAWQATTHVGCAVDCGCKASHGTWFDTSFGCQYGPSGNYQGYRPFPVDDCPPEMIHGTTTTLEPRTILEPGCYQAQKFDMLGRPELFSDWPTWENWCDQIIVGKTCEEALAYAVANGNTDCGIVILGGSTDTTAPMTSTAVVVTTTSTTSITVAATTPTITHSATLQPRTTNFTTVPPIETCLPYGTPKECRADRGCVITRLPASRAAFLASQTFLLDEPGEALWNDVCLRDCQRLNEATCGLHHAECAWSHDRCVAHPSITAFKEPYHCMSQTHTQWEGDFESGQCAYAHRCAGEPNTCETRSQLGRPCVASPCSAGRCQVNLCDDAECVAETEAPLCGVGLCANLPKEVCTAADVCRWTGFQCRAVSTCHECPDQACCGSVHIPDAVCTWSNTSDACFAVSFWISHGGNGAGRLLIALPVFFIGLMLFV